MDTLKKQHQQQTNLCRDSDSGRARDKQTYESLSYRGSYTAPQKKIRNYTNSVNIQVQNCCRMQLRIMHGEPIAIGLKVDGKYALS